MHRVQALSAFLCCLQPSFLATNWVWNRLLRGEKVSPGSNGEPTRTTIERHLVKAHSRAPKSTNWIHSRWHFRQEKKTPKTWISCPFFATFHFSDISTFSFTIQNLKRFVKKIDFKKCCLNWVIVTFFSLTNRHSLLVDKNHQDVAKDVPTSNFQNLFEQHFL